MWWEPLCLSEELQDRKGTSFTWHLTVAVITARWCWSPKGQLRAQSLPSCESTLASRKNFLLAFDLAGRGGEGGWTCGPGVLGHFQCS